MEDIVKVLQENPIILSINDHESLEMAIESTSKVVMTMYGDVEKYVKELNLDARYGYAFLLDKEGIIRWQGQSFSTTQSTAKLFELAEKLSKS